MSSPSVESEEEEVDSPVVRANRSSPGTIVFTEDGNADGWIATDVITECRR
ncbi:hypothetical protein [Haloarchaeobius sp. TZWWS8]|uniref:hypothetical protein n=1 Tax=Haloarchaeobius sp. TZWWS8 TaxID=3446121 RepID=UPI003EBF07F3